MLLTIPQIIHTFEWDAIYSLSMRVCRLIHHDNRTWIYQIKICWNKFKLTSQPIVSTIERLNEFCCWNLGKKRSLSTGNKKAKKGRERSVCYDVIFALNFPKQNINEMEKRRWSIKQQWKCKISEWKMSIFPLLCSFRSIKSTRKKSWKKHEKWE